MKLRMLAVLLAASLFSPRLPAQEKEQGTVIDEVTMYVSPDATSQKLARATRGRNVPLVMDRTTISKQAWAHVLIVVDVDLERETERQITGWVPSKMVITTATPNGAEIIFGEAADSESQAQQRGGRKHAAEDAMRLYYRIYEYFPNSPLAGEALWRAADIRWQLEKSDVRMRPSSREMDPNMRDTMDDQNMKLVITSCADHGRAKPNVRTRKRSFTKSTRGSIRNLPKRRKRFITPRGGWARWWRCTRHSTNRIKRRRRGAEALNWRRRLRPNILKATGSRAPPS